MRRVAEIMYIVEEEREEFLKGILNPDEEAQRVQWLCGIRNQQFYSLNDYIFMTFEYKGNNFNEDMSRMSAYLDSKGHLVKKRRKDVPPEERATTNWWAPVKKLGTLLESKPAFLAEEEDQDYMAMLDGVTVSSDTSNDISFAEEDWMEEVSIWRNHK